MEKGIETMARSDFWDLPERGWREDIGHFDSLVILPTRRKHDSGWRCMDFVAVRGDEPVCRLSGCSDVLHIDGIGGYGDWNPDNGLPQSIAPRGWSMDCLYKSGLLRLFARYPMYADEALSSFAVHADPEREN